ncbi:transmembrane protein 59-like isoform X2 [Archocentrus centrarchus]|uniref:transmembrane protein 59-like isoform X2 n=1 Tax=Archocentrus centrarchus TaxID=63155 RepID=UPI0011EA3F68|nr:transmembrane protein 59-like isoform X2 [Archocentrus centrarchus]
MLWLGGRMCGLSALLSVLLAGLAAASSDLFDNQLGDINYCKKQCQITIKNKSPAKDSIMNACHRGCRLYSICQFVNGNAGFNTSREECQGACQEAYIKLLEQEACSTGCASQPSEPEIKRRKLRAMTLRPKPPSVMEAVSSWCNDIVSSAQSFISSTWTFYLQADDGKVVVFQSQPEMEYSLPELQAPRSSVADKPWPQVHSHTQRPHGVRGHGEKGAPKAAAKGKHPLQHTEDPAVEHDFLGCMSRRSGLPRWILAACLFLSIMVMLWLSCASLVTAPEQHIKTQLSINGDKEFLENAHKVNPYHLSPVIAVTVKQSEEIQEAGPLPVKVDLNKTCV